MGRTAADPESDAAVGGRKPQKPRPGVAVPALNLTSQMLSKDELCREVGQPSIFSPFPAHFDRVFLAFIEFHRAIPSFIEFDRVLSSFTEYDPVLPSFTEFYRI